MPHKKTEKHSTLGFGLVQRHGQKKPIFFFVPSRYITSYVDALIYKQWGLFRVIFEFDSNTLNRNNIQTFRFVSCFRRCRSSGARCGVQNTNHETVRQTAAAAAEDPSVADFHNFEYPPEEDVWRVVLTRYSNTPKTFIESPRHTVTGPARRPVSSSPDYCDDGPRAKRARPAHPTPKTGSSRSPRASPVRVHKRYPTFGDVITSEVIEPETAHYAKSFRSVGRERRERLRVLNG